MTERDPGPLVTGGVVERLATPDPSIPERRDGLFARITSLRHANVDAAYECKSGVDRCHECAVDFDTLAALGSIPERPAEPLREALEALAEKFDQAATAWLREADEAGKSAMRSHFRGYSDIPSEALAAARGQAFQAAARDVRAALAQQSTPESRAARSDDEPGRAPS